MRRSPLAPVLLFGALTLPALPSASSGDEKAATPLELGAVVPENVELTDLDGKKLTFKELRGKVVMIHFWSTLCPWERHANPIFKRLEKDYADKKDVVILGICSNQNEIGPRPAADADLSKHYGEFRKQIAEHGFKQRFFADHGNVLSDLFGAKTTPHCFVLDKKGVLSYRGALDDDPREQKGDGATIYLKNAAEAVLAGKEVAQQETKPYG